MGFSAWRSCRLADWGYGWGASAWDTGCVGQQAGTFACSKTALCCGCQMLQNATGMAENDAHELWILAMLMHACVVHIPGGGGVYTCAVVELVSARFVGHMTPLPWGLEVMQVVAPPQLCHWVSP